MIAERKLTMHFDIHGLDAPDAPTILLSSGLGGSGAYWTPQIPVLSQHFRVITYDHRGCGRTGGDVSPDCTIADMANDVLEIVDELKLNRFHFMGHALGGLIGLDLALRKPDLIEKLILINAWSKADAVSGRCFDARLNLLNMSGVEAFVKAQPLFLYPSWWMSEHAQRLADDDAHGIAHFQGKETVTRRIAALRAFDVDDRLAEIACETLVMAARDDLLVPYTRSVRLAEGLPNARLWISNSGAHAVNITCPDPFNTQALSFLIS